MFTNNLFVDLKDNVWFERQTYAGKCVRQILNEIEKLITINPIISLNGKDLEFIADTWFNEFKCIPTFEGYKGGGQNPFPAKICVSVNNELVHGIPNNKPFNKGDVIKVDLGATFEGAIADAARTFIYGQANSQTHNELIDTCKIALEQAIESIKIGQRLGCIGNAIHNVVKRTRFGLITNYGGHGISKNKPHASPFVPNKSIKNEGIRFQSGMTLAIEPMIVIGEPKTKIADDGWTVLTPGIGAHFEHTIFINENEVKILT